MRIGIIIIFHNNEKEIDKNMFLKQLNYSGNLELCFVNNSSKDKTYNILKDIKEVYPALSIVNIKKLKSDRSAVRAGARFMFNQFNLRHIGYINANLIINKGLGLNELIKVITTNQDDLYKYSLKTLENKDLKQCLFKTMFSVLDYLKIRQLSPI